MLSHLLLSLVCLSASIDGADEEYHFILGLSRKGMHEMVVQEASTFLEKHPRHERAMHARYCLANAQFDLGDRAGARPHFEVLAASDRHDGFDFAPESAFRLGQCEMDEGRLGRARRAFEATLGSDREYLAAPAHYFMGEVLFRGEDFDGAEEHYEQARRLDADSYARDAEYGLVWCAFRREAFADVVERVRGYYPQASAERQGEYSFLAGEAQLELGQPELALQAYERVDGGDYHDDALRGAGFAAAALERHADAARWFGRLLEAYPGSRHAGEAALHQGVQLYQAGDAAAAEGVLAGPLVADQAEAALWRAQAQRELGDSEAALVTLDGAAGLDATPDLAERLRSLRGELLLGLGRSDEAARAFEDAGSEYALHAAAIAELNAGRHDQAERLARNLLSDPEHTRYRGQARLTLAEALFEQERYGEAMPEFEAVLQDDDDHADDVDDAEAQETRCRLRIAWCRFFEGDYTAAFEGFGRLERQHPDAPEAEESLFMAGRSAELGDDADGAAREYGRYVERYPDGARRHEAYLSLSRLDPERADHWLGVLLAEAPEPSMLGQGHFGLGEQLSASGDFAGAVPHYRAALEAFAGAGDEGSEGDAASERDAAYGLAWACYNRDDFESASNALGPVAGDDQAAPAMRVAALELLVWSEGRADHPDEALAAYRQFVGTCEDETRRFDAARIVCGALGRAQRHADAQSVWSSLLESTRQPGVAVAICVEQSYLALEREELEVAAAHARAAHEYAPQDPALAEALFFVGEAYFDRGEHAQAVEFYGMATVPGAPRVCQALYKQGFAQLQLENPAAAAGCFARLIEEEPDCALVGESLFLLGEAYFRQASWSQAVESLETMRRTAPRHQAMPKALFRLGLAYGELGDWETSQQVLAELAQKHADFEHLTEGELWRGRALCRLGRARAARAALARVLEGDQGVFSARARLELGQLALAEGDPDAALSEFLKVVVLYAYEDEVCEALMLAGGVLEQQGQADNARKQYEELITRHPNNRLVEVARERIGELAQR